MELVDLARSIESAAYRSWKAREVVEYDGWELRFADGFSRRGNSVYPAESSSIPIGQKIDWCRGWYASHDLDLVFRQTLATEPNLDEQLDELGFRIEGRTNVMVGGLESGDPPLGVDNLPSRQWRETTCGLWGFDLERPDGWNAIVDRIDLPAGFVSVDGEAAGLAIADGEWLGLFEIVVAPAARRRGLGSAVTSSLLRWGHSVGARRAYLQVVADNTTAIDFYGTLGFEFAYDYWYRRDQTASANSPA